MRVRRLVLMVALCGVLLALVAGVGSAASTPGVKLRVSPAGTIALDQAVTVTWRTAVSLRRDQAYQATWQGGAAVEWAPPCVPSRVRIVGQGSPRGSVVHLRFTPRFDDGTLSKWCETSSPTFIDVVRVKLGADGKPVPGTRPKIGHAGPLKLACCTGVLR